MNNELDVLIIEDDPLYSYVLSKMLYKAGHSVKGIASNYDAALKLLASADYDIVLIDIGLDGQHTGIDMGKAIHDKYKKPFIFITTHESPDQITEAVKVRPSGYLAKPVNAASLSGTIQSAVYNFSHHIAASFPDKPNEEFAYLFVKNGNKYKKLMWKDVVYLRSEKNYTCIYNALDKVEYFIRSTLPKTMQQVLPQSMQREFIQVNRGEAVQLSFIKEINEDEIVTPYKSLMITAGYTREIKRLVQILK